MGIDVDTLTTMDTLSGTHYVLARTRAFKNG